MTDDLRSWGESNTPLPDHETALAEVLSLRYRIATQQEAIDELVAGLAFYGDPSAWNQPPVKTVYHELLGPAYENQASKVRLDRGKLARALLSKHGQRT